MKSVSGWSGQGSGIDYYGFNALPGGGYQHGYCCDVSHAFWWSGSVYSSLYNFENFFYWTLNHTDSFLRNNYLNIDENDRYNVRCVKD